MRRPPIVRGQRACPAKSVKAWSRQLGSARGPYALVAKAVDFKTGASPIRAYAISQGTMPIGSAHFGDRSLRAEFLTSAARRGDLSWCSMTPEQFHLRRWLWLPPD